MNNIVLAICVGSHHAGSPAMGKRSKDSKGTAKEKRQGESKERKEAGARGRGEKRKRAIEKGRRKIKESRWHRPK